MTVVNRTLLVKTTYIRQQALVKNILLMLISEPMQANWESNTQLYCYLDFFTSTFLGAAVAYMMDINKGNTQPMNQQKGETGAERHA